MTCHVLRIVVRVVTPVRASLDAGGVDSGGGAGTHGDTDLHLGARAHPDTGRQRGVLGERILFIVLIIIFTIILFIVLITISLSVLFSSRRSAAVCLRRGYV